MIETLPVQDQVEEITQVLRSAKLFLHMSEDETRRVVRWFANCAFLMTVTDDESGKILGVALVRQINHNDQENYKHYPHGDTWWIEAMACKEIEMAEVLLFGMMERYKELGRMEEKPKYMAWKREIKGDNRVRLFPMERVREIVSKGKYHE